MALAMLTMTLSRLGEQTNALDAAVARIAQQTSATELPAQQISNVDAVSCSEPPGLNELNPAAGNPLLVQPQATTVPCLERLATLGAEESSVLAAAALMPSCVKRDGPDAFLTQPAIAGSTPSPGGLSIQGWVPTDTCATAAARLQDALQGGP